MKSPVAPPASRFVPRLVGGAGWLRGVGALLAVCGVLLGCDDNSAQTDAGEGGTPAPMPDATPCTPVVAADYDQSCTVDSDCVAVGEVARCPASGCDSCATEAVSKSAAANYQAALSAAFASRSGGGCNCPCESGAICRAGKCQAAFCGPDPNDTLPACANAGGWCAYSANTTCPGMGPSSWCAFSDEFCCLPSPYDAGGYTDASADADADAQADAGSCTAALSTFVCQPTYPSDLTDACYGPFSGVSSATCGGLAAIAIGGPPHWSFCLYQGVDAGALVGAQNITDIPELCNNTSDTITGGQVPASCSQAIDQQINPSVDGSVTIVCDGGASPRDAGLE